MPRQAPMPSVRFILNPRTPEDEKTLRNNLAKAHLLAVRSFISSLNLSNTDMEMMKELLSCQKGGTHETK